MLAAEVLCKMAWRDIAAPAIVRQGYPRPATRGALGYWLIATPLKAPTPTELDVAAGVRSP
jgi:hypothetical protein